MAAGGRAASVVMVYLETSSEWEGIISILTPIHFLPRFGNDASLLALIVLGPVKIELLVSAWRECCGGSRAVSFFEDL